MLIYDMQFVFVQGPIGFPGEPGTPGTPGVKVCHSFTPFALLYYILIASTHVFTNFNYLHRQDILLLTTAHFCTCVV